MESGHRQKKKVKIACVDTMMATARYSIVALLLIRVAKAAPPPTTPFPLLEAGGAPVSTSWDAMVGPTSQICKGDPVTIMISGASASMRLLRGPAPHTILDAPIGSPGAPFAGGAVVGPGSLILLRSTEDGEEDDALAIAVAEDCSSAKILSSARVAAKGAPAKWAGIATLATNNTLAVALASDTGDVVALTISSSGAIVPVGNNKANVATGKSAGCSWSGISTGFPAAAAATDPQDEHLLLTQNCGSDWDDTPTAVVAQRDGTVISIMALPFRGAVGGVCVADLYGDGRRVGVVARRGGGGDGYGGPRAVLVAPNATNGGALAVEGQVAWDTAASGAALQEWSGIACGRWLNAASGGADDQLLALRAYNKTLSGTFAYNVLVYGNALHFEQRRTSMEGVLGTQEWTTYLNVSTGPGLFNTTYAKELFTRTSVNFYTYYVCHHQMYDNFLALLRDTEGFLVNGRQLRVGLELTPPTEAIGDACNIPPDSSLTPGFNKTSFFNTTLGYLDYAAWGRVVGLVAQQFPHLVSFSIDDFTHDIQGSGENDIFTPGLITTILSNMRSVAPWMSWSPLMYFSQDGHPIGETWPDLFLTLDAPTFYFRNQKDGAGPCAPEKCWPFWGPRTKPPYCKPPACEHAGGCLAGDCCTSTSANAPGEIAEFASWLPPGRRLLVGFYATGHSSLGSPSLQYVQEIIPTILSQGRGGAEAAAAGQQGRPRRPLVHLPRAERRGARRRGHRRERDARRKLSAETHCGQI